MSASHSPTAWSGVLRGKLFVGWLLAVFMVASAAAALAAEPMSPDDVEGPMHWNHIQRVYRVGENLYLGGQPFGEDFRVAKELGIDLIVSLQARGEKDWDERPMIWAHGLEFRREPVIAKNFNAETLAKVNQIVIENEGRTLLIQCDSANRAAAWFAFYLVTEKGMQIDDAMAIARRAGLKLDDLAESTRMVIRSAESGKQPSPAATTR